MKVEKTVLDNGLTIITDYVPWVETVAFGLWIGAGSAYEDAVNNGAAHFFEHMAFKGTPKRNARDVSLDIEKIGGYLNAYTSREVTAYHGKVLKEDTAILADVLSDIVQNPLLKDEDMESERTVILQELMQSLDTPDDIVFDYFQEAAFHGSSMARPILGTEETIKALTPQMLRTFIEKFYGSQKTVSVVSGHLSHAQHVDIMKSVYADKPSIMDHQPISSAYKGGGIQHHHKQGLRQAQVVWGYEAPHRHDEASPAMRVSSMILSHGMSSRLMYEVREKLGLVYTISAFYHPYQTSGLWGLYAGTSPEKIPLVIEKSLEQMHDLADAGPTDAEMEQVHKQVQAHTHMLWESVNTRARLLGEHYLHTQDVLCPQKELEKLCAVRKEDVRLCMQKMLASPVTSSILSDDVSLPSDALLDKWRVVAPS